MRLLLIDNSNTRTKLCLSEGASVLEKSIQRLETRELTKAQLQEAFADLDFDAAVICSVVPDKLSLIQASLTVPLHAVTHHSPLGVGIDYPRPEQIGADRLANACAAAYHYGAPGIVVDFGTAVTFDVLNAAANYAGGVIAPGLAAMNEYLTRRTALLPSIDPHEPDSAIGKSTVDAMHAGAVYGYRGLVKEIIARIREELGDEAQVIATGGDAGLIARDIKQISTVDRHLTLEGLRLIGSRLWD